MPFGSHQSGVTRTRDLLGKGFLKTALEDLLRQCNIIEGFENHALDNGESLQCSELGESDMITSMSELRNYSDGLWKMGSIGGSPAS